MTTMTTLLDAWQRARALARPRVTVTPAPAGVTRTADVPVPMRDGVVLRVDVYLPAGEGPWPVILCAHPYGKDRLPAPGRPSVQYRLFRQPEPITLSAWTSWEAPDPGHWCPRGYVVVNCDLRGCGHSDGDADPLGPVEAKDCHDLVEWAGTQPWSTGRVGMLGVSYLALTQYKAAAQRPAHLAAISPWAGFTDAYRDLARPGGGREDGFVLLWTTMNRLIGAVRTDLRRQQLEHPDRDRTWQELEPDLSAIDVPVLLGGAFSDHLVHGRGSFEAFRRIPSQRKWLFTHRGGEWSTFYSAEALDTQRRFFDHYLLGRDNGWPDEPRVRLAIHAQRDHPAEVRGVSDYPPPEVSWRTLWLGPGIVTEQPPDCGWRRSFDLRRGRIPFSWRVPEDLDLIGPAELRVEVSLAGCDDAILFAALRVWRAGRPVDFEGSYGWPHDFATHGTLRLSYRELEANLTLPGRPVPTYARRERLRAGEVVTARIALLPQATRLYADDVVELIVQGRWFFSPVPGIGQFPARYEASPPGRCTLHVGDQARLLVPVLPR